MTDISEAEQLALITAQYAGGFEPPYGGIKSARVLNDFNEFSDETADSAPRYTNRLETQSEYITPSRPTFADGGHPKWRVRSEAKRHDMI